MPVLSHLSAVFLRHSGGLKLGLLDLLLILIGVALAYWLLPGLTEGPGF